MYLISLKSTHHAIMMEQKIKENNIKSITIPTPRAITKSCGMSIKIQQEINLQELIDIVEKNKLLAIGIFEVSDNELKRVYTNVEGI